MDIIEIGANIPILFWIIDGKEAVFAIPSKSSNYKTFGFITSDPRLIETFNELIDRNYFENNTHHNNTV